MGKMDNKEMFVISAIAFIFSPFFMIGKAIKSIGRSLGIFKEDNIQPEPPKEENK